MRDKNWQGTFKKCWKDFRCSGPLSFQWEGLRSSWVFLRLLPWLCYAVWFTPPEEFCPCIVRFSLSKSFPPWRAAHRNFQLSVMMLESLSFSTSPFSCLFCFLFRFVMTSFTLSNVTHVILTSLRHWFPSSLTCCLIECPVKSVGILP